MSPNLARRKLGFSLIELLVTLVIIGIILTVTTLAFGDFGARYRYRYKLETLAQKLSLLRQQAILENTPLAIQLTESGYQTYRWKQNTWHTNAPFHSFNFNAAVSLKIKIADNQKPNIIIQSTGLITPFEVALLIQKKQLTYTLKINQNGTQVWSPK